jgi:large subunit ribosomal protein L22
MAAVLESPQTVQAVAKFVRISPRKARLVTDNIRGRTVPEARTILAFTDRAAAVEIEKVLSSAVANAESNPALQWRGDELVVAAVFVDGGPTIKRWRARARGRVARIRKRTCHITIELEQSPAAVAAAAAAAAAAPKKRAPRKKAEPDATEAVVEETAVEETPVAEAEPVEETDAAEETETTEETDS